MQKLFIYLYLSKYLSLYYNYIIFIILKTFYHFISSLIQISKTQNNQIKKNQQYVAKSITIKNLNPNTILLGKIVQVNTQNIKLQFQNSIIGIVKLQNTIGYKTNQWLKARYLYTEQQQNIFTIDPSKLEQEIQEHHSIQVYIYSIEDNGYICKIPGKEIQFILTNQDCNKQKYMKNQVILANIQSIQQNICQITQNYQQIIQEYQIQDLQPGDLIQTIIPVNKNQLPIQQITDNDSKYQIFIEEHQKSGTSNNIYRVISIDINLGNIFISGRENYIQLSDFKKEKVDEIIQNPQILFQTQKNIYFKTNTKVIGRINKILLNKVNIENNTIMCNLSFLYLMPLEQIAIYNIFLDNVQNTDLQPGKIVNNVKLYINSINQLGIHGIFNVNKKQIRFIIPKQLVDEQLEQIQVGQNIQYKQILIVKINNDQYTITPLFDKLIQNLQNGCVYNSVAIQLDRIVFSNGITAHLIPTQNIQKYQKLNVIILQQKPQLIALQVQKQEQEQLTQENIDYVLNYQYIQQNENYLMYENVQEELKQIQTKIDHIIPNCYVTVDNYYLPQQFLSSEQIQNINTSLVNNQQFDIQVKQISKLFRLVAPQIYQIQNNTTIILSQSNNTYGALLNSNKKLQITKHYQLKQFDIKTVRIQDQSKTKLNTLFADLIDQEEVYQYKKTNQQLEVPKTVQLNESIEINKNVQGKLLLFQTYKTIKLAIIDLGLGQLGILPVFSDIQQNQITNMKFIVKDQIRLENEDLQLIGLQTQQYKGKYYNIYLLQQQLQNNIQQVYTCVFQEDNIIILLSNDNQLISLHQVDFYPNKMLIDEVKINQQVSISDQFEIKQIQSYQLLPDRLQSGIIKQCFVLKKQNLMAYILPEIHHDYNNIYKIAYLSLSQPQYKISLLNMDDTQFSGFTDIKMINNQLTMIDQIQTKEIQIGDIVDCITIGQKDQKVYVLIQQGIKGILNVEQNETIQQGIKIRCRVIRKINNYFIVSNNQIILQPTFTTNIQVQQAHYAQIIQFNAQNMKVKILDTVQQCYAMVFYSSFQNKVTKDSIQQLYSLNQYIAVVITKIDGDKIDCICNDTALVEVQANIQQIKEFLSILNSKQEILQNNNKQIEQQNNSQQSSEKSIYYSISKDTPSTFIEEEESEEQSIQFDNVEEEEEQENQIHFQVKQTEEQQNYLSDEQYIELINQNPQNITFYINYAEKYFKMQELQKAQQILNNGIEKLKDIHDKTQLIVLNLIFTNEQENSVSMTQKLLNEIKTFQAPSLICQQINGYLIDKKLSDVGLQMWNQLWKKKDTRNQIENVKAFFDFVYSLGLENGVNTQQFIDNINPNEQLDLRIYLAEKEYQKGRFEQARKLLINHKPAYINMFKLEQQYVKPENVVSLYKLIIPKCNQKLEKTLLKMLIDFVKEHQMDQNDIKIFSVQISNSNIFTYLQFPVQNQTQIIISHSGNLIGIYSYVEKSIKIFSIIEKKIIFKLQDQQANSITFNNDESSIVVASPMGQIRIYDIQSGNCNKDFVQQDKSITSLAITTHDDYIALGYYDGQVNFIQLGSLQLIQDINDNINKQVEKLLINQQSDLLAIVKDKHISIWNLKQMRFISSVSFDSKIRSVNFHYTEYYLFISTEDQSYILDINTNQLQEFDKLYKIIYSPLIFENIDKYLYCGISQQGVTLIQQQNNEKQITFEILNETPYDFTKAEAFTMRRNSLVPQIIALIYQDKKITYEIVNLKNFDVVKQKVEQFQNKGQLRSKSTPQIRQQQNQSNNKNNQVSKSLFNGENDESSQHVEQYQQQKVEHSQFKQQPQQQDLQSRNHQIRMKQLENINTQILQLLDKSETKDLLYDNILRSDLQVTYLILKQIGTEGIKLNQARKIIQYYANQLELYDVNKVQYVILQFICQNTEQMCKEFRELVKQLMLKSKSQNIDRNDISLEDRIQHANQLVDEVQKLATCLGRISRNSRERSIQDLCKQTSIKLNKIFL